MNSPGSVNGLQAEYFAKRINEETNGAIKIQVYPSSQLGTIAEMAESISSGTLAMHHTTFGGLQPLLDDLGLFDSPYIYRDVEHLLKSTDPETSPVLKELNEKLIESRNVRILYAFYFGTRELTCNRAIYTPDDLEGVKIRAIPSPVYVNTVEGMGAVAVPVDYSELTVALSTGVADGQENPVDLIYTNNMDEVQSHLMLTNHIMGAEPVVINEKIWESLSTEQQQIFTEVAKETSLWASNKTLENEESELQGLKDRGMSVIDTTNGLDREAFKASVDKRINEKFGSKWGEYYKEIAEIK
jgi:tripartite ATP-independent transporter DctP family solute receptor